MGINLSQHLGILRQEDQIFHSGIHIQLKFTHR